MRRLLIVLAMVVAVSFSGCEDKPGREAPETSRQGGPETASPCTIGFSQCTFEGPWRIHMNEELEHACDKFPQADVVIANGENENANQIADVENFIALGVDLIIISPREAAPLTEVVAKAYEQDIPVIVLNRPVLVDKYMTFIGADNMEIGRAAGEYLVERLPDGGKVVEIQGTLGATATQERHEGFHEIVDRHPDIKVIYSQPGDYKRSLAKNIMDNALQAYPGIDAVYAHNDEMAIGAFLAARSVKREQDMVFIGINGQAEAVKMVRQGLIDATFVYPTGASKAMELAVEILEGGTVPKEVRLETTRITKDENKEYQGF